MKFNSYWTSIKETLGFPTLQLQNLKHMRKGNSAHMGHTEQLMKSASMLLSHRSHGGTFVNHLPRTDSAVRTGTLLFSLRKQIFAQEHFLAGKLRGVDSIRRCCAEMSVTLSPHPVSAGTTGGHRHAWVLLLSNQHFILAKPVIHQLSWVPSPRS